MDKLTNEMLEIIENMPKYADLNGDETKLNELIQLWHDNIRFVSVNIASDYIIDITRAIIDVEHYFKSDFNPHYQAALEHLYQAVLRLHELERFSIDNII